LAARLPQKAAWRRIPMSLPAGNAGGLLRPCTYCLTPHATHPASGSNLATASNTAGPGRHPLLTIAAAAAILAVVACATTWLHPAGFGTADVRSQRGVLVPGYSDLSPWTPSTAARQPSAAASPEASAYETALAGCRDLRCIRHAHTLVSVSQCWQASVALSSPNGTAPFNRHMRAIPVHAHAAQAPQPVRLPALFDLGLPEMRHDQPVLVGCCCRHPVAESCFWCCWCLPAPNVQCC
jgi:hypothetical protein